MIKKRELVKKVAINKGPFVKKYPATGRSGEVNPGAPHF